MSQQQSPDDDDRFAAGAGESAKKEAEQDHARPGEAGVRTTVLPETGRAAAGGGADHAPETVGAVGEMDLTGRPAGPGGASGPSGGSGQSAGGGPGGGAISTGGPGTRPADAGAQSVESTLAALGDREQAPVSGAGGEGRGAAGQAESDTTDERGREV
ncbi:MAG TPA: hypothetical protein VEY09_04845 [Pyrinomonadaceae bacterium]|nr:hypothetical protein [Pyrinomonadaceae bacterium]